MIAPTNKPSHVQFENLSFLVLDAPNDMNLPLYLKEFKKYQVTDIVRACEPTYSSATVETAGFHMHVRIILNYYFTLLGLVFTIYVFV